MRTRRFADELARHELAADEAPRDAEDVARGGEETGVAAGAAGVERVAVVRLAPHERLTKLAARDSRLEMEPFDFALDAGAQNALEALAPFRRGDPRLQQRWRIELRIRQRQRLED